MKWILRPLTPRDIPAILPVLWGRKGYERVWKQIPGLLEDLLKAGSLQNTVLLRGHEVIGFGSAVFVTDGLVEAARKSDTSIVIECIQKHLAGESPILAPAGIRAANTSGGLISLRFLLGYDHRNLSTEDSAMAADLIATSFHSEIRGFNLKMLVADVTEDDPHGMYQRIGALELGGNKLVGMSREQAYDNPLSWFSHLLLAYRPPRFWFHDSQQDVLWQALPGANDDAIARKLHVSVDTVKKRWRTIYDRVREVDPAFFPAASEGSEKGRGAEKKDLLLHYLKEHPEELRPIETKRRPERAAAAMRR